MELKRLGWNDDWERKLTLYNAGDKNVEVGRVVAQYTHMYTIGTKEGEMTGTISGKIRGKAGRLARRDEFPAVGDWVVIRTFPNERKAVIDGVLPRNTKFSRKSAGAGPHEQVAAANADVVFILTSLNEDFNLRRLERYLVLAWESGARPVIVLTKADLCTDPAQRMLEVEEIAPGVSVHAISSTRQQGLDALDPYMKPGQTIALLGSSGVGKSTLINQFIGEERQKINDIRKGDDRGRHTTTHRELIVLPNGAMMMDTPGMRELHVWDAEEGLMKQYEDIEALAEDCRFNNCMHLHEPGCAVKAAVDQGEIDEGRFKSYMKLQQEMAELSLKKLGNEHAVRVNKGKKAAQMLREVYKHRKPRNR